MAGGVGAHHRPRADSAGSLSHRRRLRLFNWTSSAQLQSVSLEDNDNVLEISSTSTVPGLLAGPMSRNAGSTPSLPRRGPQWSHLRQRSRSSLDRASSAADSPASPSSASTRSTIKDDRRAVKQRICTLGIIEGHSRDEVLLNFDRLAGGVLAQTLMGITMIKGDSTRNGPGYGSLNKQSATDYGGPARGMSHSQSDSEAVIDRYVFVAKDAPKHMKDRQPDADIFVVKQIADAFGMKKGCQVFLEVVSIWTFRCLCEGWLTDDRSTAITQSFRQRTSSSPSKTSTCLDQTSGG